MPDLAAPQEQCFSAEQAHFHAAASSPVFGRAGYVPRTFRVIVSVN